MHFFFFSETNWLSNFSSCRKPLQTVYAKNTNKKNTNSFFGKLCARKTEISVWRQNTVKQRFAGPLAQCPIIQQQNIGDELGIISTHARSTIVSVLSKAEWIHSVDNFSGSSWVTIMFRTLNKIKLKHTAGRSCILIHRAVSVIETGVVSAWLAHMRSCWLSKCFLKILH